MRELGWSAAQFGKQMDNSGTLITGDFNQDGHLDIIHVDDVFYGLRLLLGDGQGHFSITKLPNGPTNELGDYTIVGDFNEDGKLDLALTAYGLPLQILLGNGDGTFTGVENTGAAEYPSKIVSADFNGDGHQDLATADDSGGEIKIFLGNGDGTFQKPKALLSKYNYPLLEGDFDGDGKADLVVQDTNKNYPSISIFYGKGDGTFTEKRVIRGAARQLASADVNGDGRTDIVVTDYSSGGTCSMYALLGNADRTVTSAAPVSFPLYLIFSSDGPLFGDFNDDGIVDVAYGAGDATHPMNVLLGSGKGTFALASTTGIAPVQGTPPINPEFKVTADFNEDGTSDLVAFVNPADERFAFSFFST